MSKAKTLLELTYDVESIVMREVTRGFAHLHVENTITENLLTELREELHEVRLTDLSTPTKILCEAYKYNGKLETAYGDIAIIIKIHYQDKTTLEGVGFLEAKKRNPRGKGFAAFDFCQIQRIYSNAPNSFVMMYDEKSITVDFKDVDIPYRINCRACFPRSIGTHAVAVANNIVLRESKLTTKMYRHSLPFSYQLCFRYLLGLDLNFSRSVVESAEKFAISLRERYIMTINVVRGNQPIDNIQLGLFDDDHYSIISPNVNGES